MLTCYACYDAILCTFDLPLLGIELHTIWFCVKKYTLSTCDRSMITYLLFVTFKSKININKPTCPWKSIGHYSLYSVTHYVIVLILFIKSCIWLWYLCVSISDKKACIRNFTYCKRILSKLNKLAFFNVSLSMESQRME